MVQAAIASLHADDPHDWPQIAALYAELYRLTGSPVVELNRAVAVAEVEGPEAALALGGRGPYVVQAALAALHADEPPDWAQIAALYGELARLTGSPVVELNRAVALAETGEVEPALALVERLDLEGYHYLHATRGELLHRLDRVAEARGAYERALELVHSDAERRLLEGRLEGLEG